MSFLVHEQQKALILDVADPGHVLANVPRSKAIEFQGKTLVVVPHDIAGAQALRKIGHMVPSPIGFHYAWPRDKMQIPAPFTNQLETAAFLTLNKRAFCLNQIGCVDAETEYLSPTGWRRMDQYDGGAVAQYNLDGTSEFIQPTEYVKKPCLDMIRIKTKYGVDQLLSPEHRVLYVSSTGTTQVN